MSGEHPRDSVTTCPGHSRGGSNFGGRQPALHSHQNLTAWGSDPTCALKSGHRPGGRRPSKEAPSKGADLEGGVGGEDEAVDLAAQDLAVGGLGDEAVEGGRLALDPHLVAQLGREGHHGQALQPQLLSDVPAARAHTHTLFSLCWTWAEWAPAPEAAAAAWRQPLTYLDWINRIPWLNVANQIEHCSMRLCDLIM